MDPTRRSDSEMDDGDQQQDRGSDGDGRAGERASSPPAVGLDAAAPDQPVPSPMKPVVPARPSGWYDRKRTRSRSAKSRTPVHIDLPPTACATVGSADTIGVMSKQRQQSESTGPKLPKVALLIETQIGPGRDMLRGIARYVRESGPWELHLEQRMQQFVEGWEPKWLQDWDGDGIIARFETDSVVNAAKRLNLPAVDVLGVERNHTFPLVHVDDVAIARLGAEHLLERGFKQFGFVTRPGEPWSDARLQSFTKTIEEHGYECNSLEVTGFDDISEEWDQFIERAAQWIRQQPKPLGLMLCYDLCGPTVMQACRRAGVAVPEEVAMVGVDDDEPLCAICNPPLTSVDPNHEEVGYQAAALLDRMMSGEAAPTGPTRVEPRTIVVRQSTEISAIDDPVVSLALSMIREHACNGLRVREVSERVPVSGTVLQRRFRAVTGRSVHEEIVRVQLRKAQELLRETDLPLRVVAEKAGFKHQEYMGAVFKSRLGVTPGQYRRKYEPASGAAILDA